MVSLPVHSRSTLREVVASGLNSTALVFDMLAE